MAETSTATLTRLTQFINESYPDADTAPGSVLNELLLKLAATIQNPIKNDIDTLGQANSISTALGSTEDTANEIIDKIASNYNITRNLGTKSQGKIKVTVTSNNTFFLKEGYVFTQPVLNLNYVVTIPGGVAITSNAASDEIPLIKSGSLYYFIVPVEAENEGPQYQVNDQTSFALGDASAVRGFVEAEAYGSFTTAQNEETDKEMITRFNTGLSNRTLLTPASIQRRLSEDYPNFKDVSVITANDPEMTRSKQNIFGISTLGMADVYLRMASGVETVTVTKTATLNTTDGLWYFDLDYNDASGFYRIISVLPTGKLLGGSLSFTSTFDYSTANFTAVNTVNNLYEARFTKYQTCNTAVTYAGPVGTTQTSFDVMLSYQPNLGEIQNLFLNGDERIACADYLVKAALPCYVTINLKLHRKTSTTVLPVDEIKQSIYNYVNSIKFGESLYASEIIDICHNYDIKYVELPIDIVGEIYTDHSTTISIADGDVLSIPTNLALGVSPKTTVFTIDYFKSVDDNRLSDAIGIEVF